MLNSTAGTVDKRNLFLSLLFIFHCSRTSKITIMILNAALKYKIYIFCLTLRNCFLNGYLNICQNWDTVWDRAGHVTSKLLNFGTEFTCYKQIDP